MYRNKTLTIKLQTIFYRAACLQVAGFKKCITQKQITQIINTQPQQQTAKQQANTSTYHTK